MEERNKWEQLELSKSKYPILSVAFSPDGRLLADGNVNGGVRLWDWANNSKNAFTPTPQQWRSNFLAFSPDGSMLVSGGGGARAIKWWNVIGKTLQDRSSTFLEKEKQELFSIAFSPDSKVLASAAKGKTYLELWNTRNGQRICQLGDHAFSVTSVAFSPDGKILASAGADGKIKLWSLQTSELIRTLESHERRVHAIAFSPSGKVLVSGGADKTVKLWQVETGELLRSLEQTDEVMAVAFYQDGRSFAIVRQEGALRVYRYSQQ